MDGRSVSRYIRLCELNKSILDRVDNEEIGLYPAVSISYLSSDEQAELNRVLDGSKYKIDIKKAETLREVSENKKLTNDKILQIVSGEFNKKLTKKSSAPFIIKKKMYLKYFTKEMNESEVESIVDSALKEYFEKRKNT
jgi:ParB family chromosome partitioning protein